MPRPCSCDRIDPAGDYRPGVDCVRCFLWKTSEQYRAHHEGRPLPPVPKAEPRPDCRHLGGPTGATVECPACAGSVRLKLFACAVFGSCTTGKPVAGVACCAGCPSYAAPLAGPE